MKPASTVINVMQFPENEVLAASPAASETSDVETYGRITMKQNRSLMPNREAWGKMQSHYKSCEVAELFHLLVLLKLSSRKVERSFV